MFSRFALALCLSAFVCDAAQAALKVSTKATQNVNCTGGMCTATAADAVLNIGDLANMLASGNVTIASESLAQDIEIDAALSWTSTHRLTLDAYNSIAFNKPVEIMGTGALTIKTGDGLKGGDFRFFEKGHVKFSDLKSNLVINGKPYALAKSIAQIKRLIYRGHGGEPYIALAKSINAANYDGGTLPVSPDVLEGLGNTISNLTISDGTDRGNVGLFVEINEVRDIGFVNVNVIGNGDEQRVGAIAGVLGSVILNSFVTGKVSATGAASRVGGLAGANISSGTVTRSWSAASISAGPAAMAAGDLIGQNDGIVKESYSTGTVASGDNVMTGGLVGYNLAGMIRNSYATGPIVGGSNSFAGGLVGANLSNEGSNPKITNSYSTGSVTGGSGAILGGLIGEDLAQTGTMNTYWDLDTSDIGNPHQGAGNVADDPGITGLTDAQLKSGLPAGFDPKVWAQNPKINNGYPYLIDNPPR